MKFKNLPVLLVAIMALGFVFTSCEKEELMTENSENIKRIEKTVTFDDVEFINGILVFENIEEYESILEYSISASNDELLKWQTEIGFVSLQSILDQAYKEERIFFEQFNPETMTDEEIKEVLKQKEEKGFSEFTNKYIELGILKSVKHDNFSTLELTAISAVSPIFLNIDGMVKIGSDIYQFTDTQCKKITDGDFSKIDLLKQTTTKNADKSIEIGNLVDNEKSDFHGYFDIDEIIDGHYKLNTGIKLRIWDYTTYRQFYYYIEYFNWKEKWFFGWSWDQDNKADTEITGSVRITIQGENYETHHLNYSKDNYSCNNVPVTGIFNVNSSKTVTFSNAGFTVSSSNGLSIYLSHGTIVK